MTGCSRSGADVIDVLVVDDGPNMADTTAEILRSRGFTVAIAATLGEALEVMTACHVRAVILDHSLRGETGVNFMDKGRDLPPVIVVSGMGPDVLQSYKTAYGEQVFTCLAKPVQPLDLIEAVKAALGN